MKYFSELLIQAKHSEIDSKNVKRDVLAMVIIDATRDLRINAENAMYQRSDIQSACKNGEIMRTIQWKMKKKS